MKKENQLSKADMKQILGGTLPTGPGCSVSCKENSFACCNGTGSNSDCHCYPGNETGGIRCDSGGKNSSSCTAPGTGLED